MKRTSCICAAGIWMLLLIPVATSQPIERAYDRYGRDALLSIEFSTTSSDSTFRLTPRPGYIETIESNPEFRDLLFGRAEIAARRGRASELATSLAKLRSLPDFSVDFRIVSRGYAFDPSTSRDERRTFLLYAVVPYLYPGVELRNFSCGTLAVKFVEFAADGYSCFNDFGYGASDWLPYGEEWETQSPLRFIHWNGDPHVATLSRPLFPRTLEISSPYFTLFYPAADSFSVARTSADSTQTLLATAALHGHTAVVDLLIKEGANIEAVSEGGNRPIHLAAVTNSHSVVERLIAAGVEVNATNDAGLAPIHAVSLLGYSKLVGVLANAGADLDLNSSSNNTPLLMAVGGGHGATVVNLIEAGADLHKSDDTGTSPLMRAAGASGTFSGLLDRKSIVSALLSAGAEKEQVDEQGQTALHYAAKANNIDRVQLLLDAGSNLNARASDGSTPLMFAAEKGYGDQVLLLAQAGADLDAVDSDGNTALMRATISDKARVVEELLRRGSSKRTKNAAGQSAVKLAKAHNSRRTRAMFRHLKPIRISYLKLGANLARLNDPQHVSSVGAELGVALDIKLLPRVHIQTDVGTFIRVTDPEEDGPVNFGAPGDFYYYISTIEARPQIRFDLGNVYRRHTYVLAGIGFASVGEVELRDYSGQTGETVVTEQTDESFTTFNFGIGLQGTTKRSVFTVELTYSRASSLVLDRFEGSLDTFGLVLGIGI